MDGDTNTTTNMDVLILANQRSEELESLCEKTSVSSLMVSGRSLLQYTLEALSDCRPNAIKLAVAGDIPSLRDFVSSGERWGVSAEVISTRFNTPYDEILDNQSVQGSNPLLVVPVDRLYTTPLNEIADSLMEQFSDNRIASQCSQTGIVLLKPKARSADAHVVELVKASCRRVNSIADYHALCLDVSTGNLSSISLRGRQVAVGLRIGHHTRIHPRCIESGHTFAGNHCHVHPTARLEGRNVINHNVHIGQMTHMENTVVLDNTAIGDHLTIRDAVVSGGHIFQITTGTHLRVTDSFILGDHSETMSISWLRNPINVLAGVIASTVALPVVIVTVAVQYLRLRRNPFLPAQLIGNKPGEDDMGTCFTSWRLDVSHRVLANLPMLKDVITGNLRLLGVSPLTPAECQSRSEDWQCVRDEAPVGVFGPTQRDIAWNADLDTRLISDALFVQSNKTFLQRLSTLATCIFPICYSTGH